MSYTRVEQNGVEFYTLKSNGASGMSISGLARLCGVSDKAIAKILRNIARTLVRSKYLKKLVGKDLYLELKGPKGARIIRAEVCSAIIRYYAFESEVKNETAEYSHERFADMGMETWIQSITGWKANQIAPEITTEAIEQYLREQIPENCTPSLVEVDGVIEILQEANLSAAGLRLYFYLEMQMLKGQQPNIDTICKDLNITPATFKKWLPKIQKWSGVAKWINLSTRKGPERQIQERLCKELNGRMEVYTPIGPIDLVTKTEIIEIKRIEDWKTAFGQVVAKSQSFPEHLKRIHLFGESSQRLTKITEHCQPFDVIVTFERLVLVDQQVLV